MGRETNGIVIKPPMEHVTSGKVFRPDRKLLYKYYFEIVAAAIVLYVIIILSWRGIAYLALVLDEGISVEAFNAYMNQWWWPVNIGYWIIMAIWMIPVAILVPLYIRSIEYSVLSESGKAMPEIYVKKGIINVTRKHVPFRTITNISSRAGLIDRLFGIGNVEIETAGFSGTTQRGPEEKLEGLVFYEELRDFILQELRKFQTPYVTATETVRIEETPVPRMDDSLQDEILIVLREIRDILKKIAKTT